ncbi:MAG: cytochrome c [Candidatus Krumholzibacteria bacterium]
MKIALKVALLTVLATAFYTYVGHMVPQKITYPPESVELRADMTTEEMVRVGEEIVGGKGTCLGCHTIGSHEAGRFPDLGGIGAKAGSRREGMSDVEYLAESLYDPGAYIVEGFNPGMIPVSKPPVSLTDQEILAVIAYLQSLGSTPTVTMQTKLEYAGAAASIPPGTATSAVPAAGTGGQSGQELVTAYGCVGCHSLDTPDKILGPSLYDVGNRLSLAELYESIMDPDATIAEGYQPGLMTATLGAVKFYDKVSAGELKTIVDYLAARKGNE